MKSSQLILYLIWSTTACCAYDISQPSKPAPSSSVDPKKKKSLDLSSQQSSESQGRAVVIVSAVCSGAVGACFASALVPQNLARQWLTVSIAGTLLLVSAGIEEGWIGILKQWMQAKIFARKQRCEAAATTSPTTSRSDLTAKTASPQEIETMSLILEQPKTEFVSFASTIVDTASLATDNCQDWAVSSSGSDVTESRQNQIIKVADQKPANKTLKPKKSHRNLLLFWKKKKRDDGEINQKHPIPAWSHFANEDNSRQFVEDYGDDDIGEGLGL